MKIGNTTLIPQNIAPTNTQKIGIFDGDNLLCEVGFGKLKMPHIGTPLYSVGLLSDTHTNTYSNAQDSYTDLTRAISWLSTNAEMTCVSGDLANLRYTYDDGLQEHKQIVNDNKGDMEVYEIAGNHEHWDSNAAVVTLTDDEIKNQVHKIGAVVTGQTADLVPMDKVIYALRDVTATVDNISLIAASIMCKKLASGANAILLDVKTGDGAFMKTLDDSFELAKAMVDIGCGMNRETIGMVTDMDEPLGFAVGNSLEVIEAIETLKGNGPKDFVLVCETLGSYMLVLAKVAKDFDEGLVMIREAITSGKALEKLKVFIENQGGDKNVVDDYTLLPQAAKIVPIKANKCGYISKIEAEEVGISAMI